MGGRIKMYYCHTHGLGYDREHTSITCNRKAPGHVDSATVIDMQGGTQKIAKYRAPRRGTTPRGANS